MRTGRGGEPGSGRETAGTAGTPGAVMEDRSSPARREAPNAAPKPSAAAPAADGRPPPWQELPLVIGVTADQPPDASALSLKKVEARLAGFFDRLHRTYPHTPIVLLSPDP